MRRAAMLLALLAAPALAEVPEPEGFRGEPYGAPTPAGLAGAVTVTTDEARALWDEGDAAFVDVLPREPRPPDLPEGTVWRDRPRDSIPGAVWLPNTGYQEISAPEEAYLRDGLALVTEGDPSRPVLFFCRAECWMSWNAAKRALAMGYSAVHWYPEGTDGWTQAGLPVERVEPWEAP